MTNSCRALAGSRRCAWLAGVAMGMAAAGAALAQDAPASGPPRTVDINEYFVEGNTVLTDSEIERAVYPFLGPDRTPDDVERARTALQKAYEARGLKTVFVEIPQQNVSGGRVRLAVVQARIGAVGVTGMKHAPDARVIEALPAIAPGSIPNLDRFSEELMALNSRSPDRQVTPELKPGAEPNTVDVVLGVEDKLPLHGALEVNNGYSRDTTKTRLQANLRYDDLWGRGHSGALFYAVAPERPSDSEVYVLSYGAPVGEGLRLDVTGLVSNSDVATVGSTNVLGDGSSLSVALSRVLGGSARLYHRVTATAAWKDFDETVRFGDVTDKAPITYYPISLGYAGTLAEEGSELGFNAALTFAVRGLGSTSGDFDYKRYRATGGFFYLRGGLTYRRDLPGDSELFLSFDGQLANEPLISNEQFSIGGAGSVRGYLQSQAVGDNGLAGVVELRSPDFSGRLGGLARSARIVGFLDAAQVWTKSPLAEQEDSVALIGAGLGLRVKLLEHVSGDIDLAWPLSRAGDIDPGDGRVHLRLTTDF